MPPALDRLLASPSALRLLRTIVNGPEVSAACLPATFCCHTSKAQRRYATNRPKPVKGTWRRWQGPADRESKCDAIRQFLEQDAAPDENSDRLGTMYHGTKVSDDATRDTTKWVQALSQQERQEGERGIMAVWKELQRAHFDLPCDSSDHAEYLWGTFIKHPHVIEEVIEHAAELFKKEKQTPARLYPMVMNHWLPRDATKALEYHRLMMSRLEVKDLRLKGIARKGQSLFKPAAYEALMAIYQGSHDRDLYDEVVPTLISKGHINLARRWHILCMSRKDRASDSVAQHPVIRIFRAEALEVVKNKPQSQKSSKDSKDVARKRGLYNEELMQRLLGRDTAPVRFEDSFCARLFATGTFPAASVISGLALVGVNEVGPQAVLAMALRTEPLEDLPTRFEELRTHGIALQGSVYSLAIEKFAKEHKWKLVRSMLDSDQHPDVFGDAEVQRKLLDFYLDQEDHVQAQRTLAILTLFHNHSSQESWNLLLQLHIKRTGAQHVTEVLQDMRVRGVMVSMNSIAAIKSLLRHRRVGRKPTSSQHRFDDLRFVTRVLMSISEFGMGPVPPRSWHELIRRFGMTGRFKELRRLLLWLLCWYAPRSRCQFTTLPTSPFRARALEKFRTAHAGGKHWFFFPGGVTQRQNSLHPVRELIPPSLQQGLIIWGFRTGLLPNANLEQSLLGSTLSKKHYRHRLLQQQILKRSQWSIGLRTVVLLRDLGVHVHYHTVVKALQMQFTVLFGRGRSNKLENRIMERVNTIPYAQYVREVNNIWGSNLFREPQLFPKGMIHDHMWHPRMRRKIDRRAFIRISDILGKDWQKRDEEIEKTVAGQGDAALKELERRFEAQAKAPEPGLEWMMEASLDTRGASEGGRVRRVAADGERMAIKN
jgi:hypothetical protein